MVRDQSERSSTCYGHADYAGSQAQERPWLTVRPRTIQLALPWTLFGVCFVAVLVLAAMLLLPRLGLFGVGPSERNTQVIESVTREEQVALVSLGIQGIEEETDRMTVPLLQAHVPGSERATFVQYSFTAKLGLDGDDVEIVQTGEDAFRVSVPDFIFIGHDDEDFRLVTENNGVLSWLTPEIDELAMVNSILNDEAKEQYINSHEDLLKAQTESFYGGIITSVDPSVTVEFDFH